MTESPKTPQLGKDVTEDDGLGRAVQRFVQVQSFNAFERLLASYLVQAITGDPLEGVIFVCRAALSLDEDRCQKLGIKFQEVLSLYSVAQMLNSPVKISDDGKYKEVGVSAQSLNWGTDILPWAKMESYQFSYYPSEENQTRIDRMEKEASHEERFIFCCDNLTEKGYNHMVSDFLIYAMPKSQEITRLLSQIISPSTWSETYAMIKGSEMTKIRETPQ